MGRNGWGDTMEPRICSLVVHLFQDRLGGPRSTGPRRALGAPRTVHGFQACQAKVHGPQACARAPGAATTRRNRSLDRQSALSYLCLTGRCRHARGKHTTMRKILIKNTPDPRAIERLFDKLSRKASERQRKRDRADRRGEKTLQMMTLAVRAF